MIFGLDCCAVLSGGGGWQERTHRSVQHDVRDVNPLHERQRLRRRARVHVDVKTRHVQEAQREHALHL